MAGSAAEEVMEEVMEVKGVGVQAAVGRVQQ